MRRLIIVLLAVVSMITSCEKEEKVKYSGFALFTSEPGGEFFINGYGFSFEQGKNIICADINCKQADIVTGHLILQTEINEVFLTSPENQEAFHLNASFDNEDEAVAYYDDYGEVTAQDFDFSAGNLQPNQVWTFQSAAKKYAKIRIIEIQHYYDANYPFAEVRVEYHYQPSGSGIFNR